MNAASLAPQSAIACAAAALSLAAETEEAGFEWTADVILFIAAVPMTIGVAVFAGWLFWRAGREERARRERP